MSACLMVDCPEAHVAAADSIRPRWDRT